MAGATSDPDEYDDMVIGHEYGHFTMDKYSTDDTPAGSHSPSTPADPRLALSEGWATFFAGAALNRSEYIDTNAEPENTTYYSFETPPAEHPRGTAGSKLTGNLSEVIPNAVLWDLLDENNETKDTLQSKGTAIWKVMTTYLKSGYAKFTGPFSGALLPEKAKVKVGKALAFTLTLETREKFGAVGVSIKLPQGVELVKGERKLRLVNFAPGEKKKFFYLVRVTEKGERQVVIAVKAEGLSEGFGLGTAFVSFINPGPIKDNGTHTVDSGGTKVFVK